LVGLGQVHLVRQVHDVIAAQILTFGHLLRRAGLAVHTGRLLDSVEALTHVELGRRADVKAALRTLLVHRREDLVTFDRAFDLYFRARHEPWGRADLRSLGETRSRVDLRFAVPGLDDESAEAGAAPDEPRDRRVERRTWSAREAFRQKSFAAYTESEIADARAALRALEWSPGLRRTRRFTPGRSPALDVRRLIRRSLATGGEPVERPRRVRTRRPRRLVVIADISGSMERYSRMLLHFAHALVARRRHVEAFLFSTRLSRITRQLRQADADAAARAVGHAVHDWAGGTRIGDALRAFNVTWARRVLGGAVVLLVSDGWDRGEPRDLARELAWLHRSCHRLIWLNPLLGTAGYEPLTRGMVAARPHIDDFLPAHNLASMEALAERLNSLG
jgi:uncharacterized protein with von Willebrand factor type A (vWA) domain